MNFESSDILVLGQRYHQARRRVLTELKERGLRVAFGASSGLLRSAGVRTMKSSVLCVGYAYQLLVAFVAGGAASIRGPLYVVRSDLGPGIQVHIQAQQTLRKAGITLAIIFLIRRTLSLISVALVSIGTHSGRRTLGGLRLWNMRCPRISVTRGRGQNEAKE